MFKGSYDSPIDRSGNLNSDSCQSNLQTMEGEKDSLTVDSADGEIEVDVGSVDSVNLDSDSTDREGGNNLAGPMAENIDRGNSDGNICNNFMENFLRQMTEKLNEMKNEIQCSRKEMKDEIKQGREEARNSIESKLNDFRADVTTDIQNNIGQLDKNLKLNLEKVTENFQGNLEKVQSNVGEIQATISSFQNQMENKFDNINLRFEQVNSSVNVRINSAVSSVNEQIAAVSSNAESQIKSVGEQLSTINSQIDARINEIDRRVVNLDSRVETRNEVVTSVLNSQSIELLSRTEEMLDSRITAVTDSLKMQVSDIRKKCDYLESTARALHNESYGRLQDVEDDVNYLLSREGGSKEPGEPAIEDANPSDRPNSNLESPSIAGNGGKSGENVAEAESSGNPEQGNFQNPSVNINVRDERSKMPVNLINEITVPKFATPLQHNPMMFLNELDNYFKIKGIPDPWKMLVVKNALAEKALSWFNLTVGTDVSYEVFKKRFLLFFWSSSMQNDVKSKLNFGRYKPGGNLNLVEYCIELGGLNKLLDPPLDTRAFIDAVIQHYPDEVRNALIVAKLQDFDELLDLLKQLQDRPGKGRGVDPHTQAPTGRRSPRPEASNSKLVGGGAHLDSSQTARKFANKGVSGEVPFPGGSNPRGNRNSQGNLGQHNGHDSSWNSTRRYRDDRPRPNFNGHPRDDRRPPFNNDRGGDNRRTPRVNQFHVRGQWRSRWWPPRWRPGNHNGPRWDGWYRFDRNDQGGGSWQRSRGQRTRGPDRFNEHRQNLRYLRDNGGSSMEDLIDRQNDLRNQEVEGNVHPRENQETNNGRNSNSEAKNTPRPQ